MVQARSVLSYCIWGIGGLMHCFRCGLPHSSAGDHLLSDLLYHVISAVTSCVMLYLSKTSEEFVQRGTNCLTFFLAEQVTLLRFVFSAFHCKVKNGLESRFKPHHNISIFCPCIWVPTLRLVRLRSHIWAVSLKIASSVLQL